MALTACRTTRSALHQTRGFQNPQRSLLLIPSILRLAPLASFSNPGALSIDLFDPTQGGEGWQCWKLHQSEENGRARGTATRSVAKPVFSDCRFFPGIGEKFSRAGVGVRLQSGKHGKACRRGWA